MPSVLSTKTLSESDFPLVQGFHEQMGFDYLMPDLASPLFVLKHGVYDEKGRLLGVGALRLQAEAYLWVDTTIPISVRYKLLFVLCRSLAVDAWRMGLDCAVAYLPPNLPKSFTRLLTRLGWLPMREGWKPWSREIK